MKKSMLITCSMLILPIFCFAEDAEAPKEPVIPRIVPVDPLLSQVNAKTGYMRFWANVPTNGCKIVATVDGKPLGPMSVGKHKVVVKLVEDATGKVKVENTYPIIAVNPKPEKKVGRRLNNFVTEVLNVPLRDGAYTFTNPRVGWVFIAFDKPYANGQAYLTGYSEPVIQYRPDEPSETRRCLAEGEYTLRVRGVPPGGRLRVHLVKTFGSEMYNAFNQNGGFRRRPHENFSWEFMRRTSAFSMGELPVRTYDCFFAGRDAALRRRALTEIEARGIRVYQHSGVGSWDWQVRTNRQAMCRQFVEHPGYKRGYPIAFDENGFVMEASQVNNVSEAAWEMANLQDPRPIWMDWYDAAETNCDWTVILPAMAAVVNSGLGTGQLFSETYIRAMEHARTRQCFENWIKGFCFNMRTLAAIMPVAATRFSHELNAFDQIGDWTTTNEPQVDAKPYIDELTHRLATDPAFADVGGMIFTTPMCSEELLRWGARLVHYYALEGGTERLSDKYGWKWEPDTMRDGDFREGLAQWQAKPAEEGGIRTDRCKKFENEVQVRVGGEGLGDTFAVLKRSAKGPNRLSQKLRNLVPGRSYALLFATSDYADVQKPGTVRVPETALDVEVKGMPFDEFYTICNVNIDSNTRTKALTRSCRKVFRATASEAELVFTDWGRKDDPCGEIGREVTLNYVSVNPYYEPTGEELLSNGRDYYPANYGAKGDGKADDTQAIQRALDEAATAGAGRVYLPTGVYRCSTLTIKTNVELTLDHGATLVAIDPSKPVITVRGQTNVAVTGEGAIKGCGGAQTIVVEDSSDVLVEGLRLIDAPAKSCVFRNDNILKVRLIRTVGATDPADNFTIERCTVAEFLGCTAAVCDVK